MPPESFIGYPCRFPCRPLQYRFCISVRPSWQSWGLAFLLITPYYKTLQMCRPLSAPVERSPAPFVGLYACGLRSRFAFVSICQRPAFYRYRGTATRFKHLPGGKVLAVTATSRQALTAQGRKIGKAQLQGCNRRRAGARAFRASYKRTAPI